MTNQQRAREQALKLYWAATCGDDPPCPDVEDIDSLEPEDIGAIERMQPMLTALLDAVEREAEQRTRSRVWLEHMGDKESQYPSVAAGVAADSLPRAEREAQHEAPPGLVESGEIHGRASATELDAALSQVAALREALQDMHSAADELMGDSDSDCDPIVGRMGRAMDVIYYTTAAAKAHDERIAREAREDEREQCAKVADEHREHAKALQRSNMAASVRMGARLPKDRDEFDVCQAAAANASNVAAAIRARKEAGENDAASGQEHREPASGADSLPTPTAPQAATPASLNVTEADLMRLAEMGVREGTLVDSGCIQEIAARVLREWREGV